MSEKRRVVWVGKAWRDETYRVVLGETGVVVEFEGKDAMGAQAWFVVQQPDMVEIVCGKAIEYLAGALSDAETRIRIDAAARRSK